MASVAEKKRRKKTAISMGRAGPRPEASPAPRATVRSKNYIRRQTGLEALAGKGKLNGSQRFNLERYGRLYRISAIEDGAALRSSLADLESARGSVGGGLPTMDNYASVIAQGREDLLAARSALSFHVDLILACDMVCGRGLTPQEITAVRTEMVELETSLRLAGDMLAKHFDAVGWQWS